jgi:hypothetical protein
MKQAQNLVHVMPQRSRAQDETDSVVRLKGLLKNGAQKRRFATFFDRPRQRLEQPLHRKVQLPTFLANSKAKDHISS